MKDITGFTIIEVVIAIALLSIAFVGLAGATGGMIKMVARGDRAATAAVYGQERLERLRSVGCAAMADGTDTRGAYQLSWVIAAPNALVRRIQLVTTYPGNGGAARVDTMETSVSCR